MRFSTWVEIDLDALAHNIGVVRSTIPGEQRILLVVKADAYGHGAVEVARAATDSGVDMLGVATLQEGIELRQAGIDAPVLILSPPMAGEAPEIIEYDLSCTIPSLGIARALSRAAASRGKVAAVHVEIDTGMGRSGVAMEDAIPFATAVSKLPNLVLEGLFTHFPSSDIDPEFTREQVSLFLSAVGRLSAKGVSIPLLHAANSAAILGVAETVERPLNMVRPGIMIYGLRPSQGLGAGQELRPVMSFKARIAQLRDLPAGHPVSYGGTFVAPCSMRVAVIPAGYGHGLSFRLSNEGEVLIRGKRAPIIGRVTMDVTMADVRGVPDAEVGDEAVIFGRQGGDEISVDEIAAKVGTINYEVICGIGKRVARVYVREGHVIGMRTLTERRVVGRKRGGAVTG